MPFLSIFSQHFLVAILIIMSNYAAMMLTVYLSNVRFDFLLIYSKHPPFVLSEYQGVASVHLSSWKIERQKEVGGASRVSVIR